MVVLANHNFAGKVESAGQLRSSPFGARAFTNHFTLAR
jgi:hypothetical protein